jgi:hypothetical protein
MEIFGLVEDLPGLNAQASEDRLPWLIQTIFAQTDLNGGGAVLQSDHMFRGILAAAHEARDRLPEAGDFCQKGFRFHNITSVGDVVTTKALKKNRAHSPVSVL